MRNSPLHRLLLPYSSIILISLVLLSASAWGQQKTTKAESVNWFIDHLFSVTGVMVSDVASPPGAARFYAYALLGAYAVHQDLDNFDEKGSLFIKFNEPLLLESPDVQAHSLNREFCSTYSMLEVAKKIMPSGKNLSESQEILIKQYLKGKILTKKQVASNVAYAVNIADQVLAYASTDGYEKLSTHIRYSPKKDEGSWYPTPPAYIAAIEPEWRTIRAFFLHPEQFIPSPPAPFSMENGSEFQRQVKEVYSISQQLTEEQKLIANFWDCNPFMVSYSGHMAIGLKKISPGGHWIGITGIASQQAGLSLKETVKIHTLLALGLHDAFISCWQEKYRSDRIRPVTVINKYLDPSWQPILQTPPFPEYTSGHSVISRTSAVILTNYFGENFDFIDTSEVFFGLPERPFGSFMQAADEAAISRLYGGIHFRDAIEVGLKQGDKIAHHILERVSSPQPQNKYQATE